MELASHAALEGVVNHLMLLDPGFSGECRRHDIGQIMVAITAQIVDADFGIRQRVFDQILDLAGSHWHLGNSPGDCGVAPDQLSRDAIYVGNQREWASRSPATDIGFASGSVNATPPTVPIRSMCTPASFAAAVSAVASAHVTM